MPTARKKFMREARRQKNNAMSPLNWFVGIAETALMSGLIMSQDIWVKIVCLVLVVGVLAFYGYVYYYFMKSDPNRLQTEEFNLLSQEMTLLAEKLGKPTQRSDSRHARSNHPRFRSIHAGKAPQFRPRYVD